MTPEQQIQFGNLLLSDERKESYKETTRIARENGFTLPPTEERLKVVSHADVENFKYRD